MIWAVGIIFLVICAIIVANDAVFTGYHMAKSGVLFIQFNRPDNDYKGFTDGFERVSLAEFHLISSIAWFMQVNSPHIEG